MQYKNYYLPGLTLFLSLTFSISAGGALLQAKPKTAEISVSHHFRLNLPNKDWQLDWHLLPAHFIYHFVGKLSKAELLVHRVPSPYLPNRFLAEKYWKEQLADLRSLQEESKNLGCIQLRHFEFRCDREGELLRKNKKYFVVERMFWLGKNDMVSLRVSSSQSIASARQELTKIQWKNTSRQRDRMD